MPSWHIPGFWEEVLWLKLCPLLEAPVELFAGCAAPLIPGEKQAMLMGFFLETRMETVSPHIIKPNKYVQGSRARKFHLGCWC